MEKYERIERGVAKRGGRWYVSAQGPDGKRVREVAKLSGAPVTNLVQARSAKAILEGRLREGRHVAPDKMKLTIGDLLDGLIEHWRTAGPGGGPIRSYANATGQLAILRKDIGGRRAREWRYKDSVAYVARGTTPGERSTMSSRMSMLRAAFAVAKKNEMVEVVPAFSKRVDNVRTQFLEPESFAALLADAGFTQIEEQILRFAYATGQRICRLLELHLTDVDSVGWTIAAEPRHGNKQRPAVPLVGGARGIAEDRIRAAVGPGWKLFHREGEPITYPSLEARWKRAMKRKGLPWRIHDLRRSAARNLIEAGVDSFVAAEITGQSVATLKRYAINPSAAMRRAAVKVDSYVMDRLRESGVSNQEELR